MSNTDAAPAEVPCAASAFTGVLHPRQVPLGGPRAIRVRRTLPQRERSLIGAQIDLEAGAAVNLQVDPLFEHGVLLDRGGLVAAGAALDVADLAYQPIGYENLTLHNTGDGPARAIVLGGPPFGEELVMWWNFVGRSHDDIAAYRRQWENRDDRFGEVEGYQGPTIRLPAPPLPNATLRPRPNPKETT